jgi:hypothetical protein
MLKTLELRNVGPSRQMRADFAPRLNLLTGDNGLGKTFLMDVAWWALTRKWADHQALPDPDLPAGRIPSISFQQGAEKETGVLTSEYSYEKQAWPLPEKSGLTPVSVMYVRTDGGICLWDPLKGGSPYIFKPHEVWDGLKRGRQRCNGLIDDWTSWQLRSDEKNANFRMLEEVLAGLSPSDQETMAPDRPVRISLQDPREIPAIRTPYGRVPVTHASSGCRRVLSIAYLLVWMWSENKEAAKIRRGEPARNMVFLFDEVESHLHPQWQRRLLPALMRVLKTLEMTTRVQFIASTHAPLVLASVEPLFTPVEDALTVFDLADGQVTVERADWRNFGDVSSWLTSRVFGLGAARLPSWASYFSKKAEDSV